MQILDGKKVAMEIRNSIREKIIGLKKKPGLAVVIVGSNPASQLYVKLKEKACNEVGFYSEKHVLSETVEEKELIELVEQLNMNKKINGILVQLPLPSHINEENVLEKIIPEKDVDGFHALNAGKLMMGKNGIVPCTPKGIIRLLEYYKIELSGKNAVVVGRSNIVGKPIAQLLLQKNATVTVCHSRTQNLGAHTVQADILVAAVGKPKMITNEMVKENAVVVDVGTTKVDGKLFGDVDFENVKEKTSYITPVPGGVGPMTIAMLLENTLEVFLNENSELGNIGIH